MPQNAPRDVVRHKVTGIEMDYDGARHDALCGEGPHFEWVLVKAEAVPDTEMPPTPEGDGNVDPNFDDEPPAP